MSYLALDAAIANAPPHWDRVDLRRLTRVKRLPNRHSDRALLALSAATGVRERDADGGRQLPSTEAIASYWLVEPNDLVVNPMWALEGGVAVSGLRGAVSPAYRVYTLNGRLWPRFAHYYCRSSAALYQYRLLVRGVTTFDRSIGREDFEGLPVALPPLDEQRRIAEFLDRETARIDALIANKQRMIELFKERRRAAIDHAVLGASGPARPIASLGVYINGWPFKPTDFAATGLPVIRIRQLVDASAEPDLYDGPLPKRVLLRDGDIVFSWSGSLEVREWGRGPAWLNQHLFRVVPASGVDRHWLLYALDCATRLFEPFMHGSAMTHITQPMMKAVRVPLPSVEEQRAVATRLRSATARSEEVVHAVEHQMDLLRERRQSLITHAVTGQLPIAA